MRSAWRVKYLIAQNCNLLARSLRLRRDRHFRDRLRAHPGTGSPRRTTGILFSDPAFVRSIQPRLALRHGPQCGV